MRPQSEILALSQMLLDNYDFLHTAVSVMEAV